MGVEEKKGGRKILLGNIKEMRRPESKGGSENKLRGINHIFFNVNLCYYLHFPLKRLLSIFFKPVCIWLFKKIFDVGHSFLKFWRIWPIISRY